MASSAQDLTISKVNVLPNAEFIKVFNNIVECYPKVAEAVSTQRPFESVQHFTNIVNNYLDKLEKEEKETILKLHPDLAGRLADQEKLTAESTEEQKSAGLDKLSTLDKKELNNLNNKYKDKFGFPFVICARENKAPAILNGLKNRMENSKEVELLNGIAEVKKICNLRIHQLVH